MKVVIAILALVVTSVLAVAFNLHKQVPQPVANTVIGEKAGKTVGNQAAFVVPANLSEKQHRLLNLAYEIGKANGLKNPEIVQAILLQETMAGGVASYRVANPGPEAYFGPMQIKLSAARDVLNRWPELFKLYSFHTRTDDEVKANLILNERFNIDVATRYIRILKDQYGFSGRQLMNAYNRGPGGVREVGADFHYAIGAEQKLASFKQRTCFSAGSRTC